MKTDFKYRGLPAFRTRTIAHRIIARTPRSIITNKLSKVVYLFEMPNSASIISITKLAFPKVSYSTYFTITLYLWFLLYMQWRTEAFLWALDSIAANVGLAIIHFVAFLYHTRKTFLLWCSLLLLYLLLCNRYWIFIWSFLLVS